jgi:hypothetical protein
MCKYPHTICHILSFGVIEYKLCMQAHLLCFASEGSAIVCNSSSGACKGLFELKFVFLREYIGQHIVDKIVCKFYAEHYCSTML